MTPEQVITAARIDLKDNFQIDLQRWSESDMFSYIQQAIDEISNAFPQMTQSTAEVQLSPGVFQEIPADWKALLRIELNSMGIPVFEVDRDTSNAFYAHRPSPPSDVIEEYWRDVKSGRTFYVHPPASNNATVVAQGSLRQPPIESPEQDLTIVDEALSMVVNQVLYRAYRKDSEVAQARQVAEWYFGKSRQDLGLKAAMDAIETLPASQVVAAIAQVQAPDIASSAP